MGYKHMFGRIETSETPRGATTHGDNQQQPGRPQDRQRPEEHLPPQHHEQGDRRAAPGPHHHDFDPAEDPVEQVQLLAERAVLVPVGASLLARDNLVSTVKGLATRYRTRTALERELKRYERRGATARNRFERQVSGPGRGSSARLRQRRSLVERTVKQNRRRFEREVRSVRKDLEKQSGIVGARVEKLVSEAQGLIGSAS